MSPGGLVHSFCKGENEQAYQVEHQHGRSIGAPVLILVLVNSAYSINQSFQGAEGFVQECPFSGKYPGHVDTERLGDGEQNQEIYSEL